MKFSVGGLAVVLAGALALVAAAPAAAGEPVVARSDVIRAAFDEFGTLTALAGPDGVDLIDVVTPSFYGGPLGAGGAAWRPVGLGAQVVSMANEGDSTVNYPAGYPEVVSVAATDDNDARASFSNTNPDVEVAAPGVSVLSTIPEGRYARFSGTSMATPHVSGVAAVLWQLFPGDTAAGIRDRLTAAVDDRGPAGRDASYGFGRVNLCKAAGGAC